MSMQNAARCSECQSPARTQIHSAEAAAKQPAKTGTTTADNT